MTTPETEDDAGDVDDGEEAVDGKDDAAEMEPEAADDTEDGLVGAQQTAAAAGRVGPISRGKKAKQFAKVVASGKGKQKHKVDVTSDLKTRGASMRTLMSRFEQGKKGGKKSSKTPVKIVSEATKKKMKDEKDRRAAELKKLTGDAIRIDSAAVDSPILAPDASPEGDEAVPDLPEVEEAEGEAEAEAEEGDRDAAPEAPSMPPPMAPEEEEEEEPNAEAEAATAADPAPEGVVQQAAAAPAPASEDAGVAAGGVPVPAPVPAPAADVLRIPRPEPIRLSGWITKGNKAGRSWKRRFFVLDTSKGSLDYYADD